MRTLGIDTSNYATSLAVFDTNAGEVVCDCKKFLPVKAGQLGLRQSDALFHHTAALPDLLAELGTKADLTQIGAVGVSATATGGVTGGTRGAGSRRGGAAGRVGSISTATGATAGAGSASNAPPCR